MNIKVGDTVRFLNDVGGGVVSKVVDRHSVMVENEFGFDVPTKITELVVIDSAEEYTASSKSDTSLAVAEPAVLDSQELFYPEVAIIDESGDDIHIHFAFVPQGRPGNSDLDVYIINDSNYNVLYSIINKEDSGVTESNKVGVLEANTKEQIESLGMISINEITTYVFHFIFYRNGAFNVKEPITKELTISPVKFYKEKAYGVNDFFNEDAILYPLVGSNPMEKKLKELTNKDFNKIIAEKEQANTNVKSKSNKQIELLEVDLHIHELLDDFRGLSNGEMLEIQTNAFKEKLAEAMKSGPKKIVFIHGVGSGTLKTEIRRELDRMKGKLSFQDASFKEYGYGATMVKIF